MEKFIICDGKKYIIEDNDIYKVLNARKKRPTKNELSKVKVVIENIGKDIFNSPKLNEIAKKNKELYKIDILPEILKRMEKFIGKECIESFYKNLETVKFEFENPIKCKDSNIKYENGYHEGMTNIIHINAETFDCLKQYAKDNGLNFTLVWKIALTHELFHLASCKNLLSETGYIYQGVSEICFNKKQRPITDKNRRGISTSFNEGITQLFASALYSDELDDNKLCMFNNTYVEQARVIYQLISMVGFKNIKNSYFKNSGMNCIHNKLLQIDHYKIPYNQLSTHMGRLISDTLSNTAKNTSIVRIQNILLQYEIKFIDTLDKEERESFVDSISCCFIGLWKNIDNMNLSDETKALIKENLTLFNHLQEKQKTYKK